MYIGCNYINCLHLVDVWAQCDECEVSIVLSFGCLLPAERGFEEWMRILINRYI